MNVPAWAGLHPRSTSCTMNIRKMAHRVSPQARSLEGTAMPILLAMGLSHFLNDMIQSVIPSIYPILKDNYAFSFAEIGIITLVFQLTSSILQPLTGLMADRHPRPFSLARGMCFTLVGLLLLACAGQFWSILLAVGVIGLGSSIFHPEASRLTQLASGGKKSLAQSVFQVGGNGGTALGPVLAALVVLPFGQGAIGWFALAAIVACGVMMWAGTWYKAKLAYVVAGHKPAPSPFVHLSRRRVRWAMTILVLLVFSKYFYLSSMTSYFTFFLMDKFGIGVRASQFCLFAFLAASALGTLGGGLLGDRFGRKYVIWGSILGAAPFALLMPYVGLTLTVVLSIIVGLVISSAFSSIVVYATDLMPDKVGMVAGLFFGLMFGLGGVGSAFFGWLADRTSIEYVFQVSTLLPLLGIIAGFLPNTQKRV